MKKLKIFGKKNKPQDEEEQDMFDQLEEEYQDGEAEQIEDPEDEEQIQEEGEEEQWLEGEEEGDEGQLAVDVYQDGANNIVIKSTIAGVKPEDVDVNINNDMVTIRGSRAFEDQISEDNYFYQECYWGNFSRSIVLPQEVIAEKAQASIKNGVLTITLPKTKSKKSVAIKVKHE